MLSFFLRSSTSFRMMIIWTVYRIILILDVTSNTKDGMQLVPLPPRHSNVEKKRRNEGANPKALPILGEGSLETVFPIVHFLKQPVAVYLEIHCRQVMVFTYSDLLLRW